MTLGAEPKKIAALAALVLIAGYLILSDPSGVPEQSSRPATRKPAASPLAIPAQPSPQVRRAPTRSRGARRIAGTFRPDLRRRRPEDRPDPMKVDPTLQLDLLAKLQAVEANGVKRSLFDFGAPPAPEDPEPKILPDVDDKIKEAQREAAAKRAEERKKRAAKKPPPPINLKFYGFIQPSTTDRRAFFLDGEAIFVASEGDLIDKRYKVIRIGLNSAVVEDTEHDHKQTLALVAELKG